MGHVHRIKPKPSLYGNLTWLLIGKVGKESAAVKFAAATQSDDFKIEDEKPYAEVSLALEPTRRLILHTYHCNQLWMGTHPSLPSKDLETQRSLLELVQENKALMSPEISEKYEGKLPFLFKVLSIRKALSIQAHPNKKLAEQLHSKDPKNYPGLCWLRQNCVCARTLTVFM